MFSAALYARVRQCAIFGTRDRGCSAHPAFPAPSVFEEGQRIWKTRAKPCRENANHAPHPYSSSPARPGDPVFQRRQDWNREAAADMDRGSWSTTLLQQLPTVVMGPAVRNCALGRDDQSYPSRRVELLQFFSDDQTLRDRRKQSTGVEEPSASKRCSSTPLHWKPHFSRMLRDDGLATRAPENSCSMRKLLEEIIDHGARGLGAKTLAPMLDAEPVAEFRRFRLELADADHADRRVVVLDQEHGFARPARRWRGRIRRRGPASTDTAGGGYFPQCGDRWRAAQWLLRPRASACASVSRSVSRTQGLASRNVGVGISCSIVGLRRRVNSANKKGGRFPASPLEPFTTPPVHQDPAESM